MAVQAGLNPLFRQDGPYMGVPVGGMGGHYRHQPLGKILGAVCSAAMEVHEEIMQRGQRGLPQVVAAGHLHTTNREGDLHRPLQVEQEPEAN